MMDRLRPSNWTEGSKMLHSVLKCTVYSCILIVERRLIYHPAAAGPPPTNHLSSCHWGGVSSVGVRTGSGLNNRIGICILRVPFQVILAQIIENATLGRRIN